MNAQFDPIPQVSKAVARPEFTLEIDFTNGDKGLLPVQKYLQFTGYFAPLAQPEFFNQVFVDHGTLCWPNEIDLDPVIVHAWAVGQPIELAGTGEKEIEPSSNTFQLPLYLEPDVEKFMLTLASQRDVDIQILINEWLRANIKILQSVPAVSA